MATPPPTRFLVQHCLQGGERSAVVREIPATSSFADIANTVLTNSEEFTPIEVANLSLEAFQPDSSSWIEARTIPDLMASRKLRVVVSQLQLDLTSLPKYTPPTSTPVSSSSEPAVNRAPPLLPANSAVPKPNAPQLLSTAPPPLSTPTSITIEIKDILLAIGSLPRTTEPSCSSVLEHLARQRLPSLGVMVEAALRECGHQPVWDHTAPRPVPSNPPPTVAPFSLPQLQAMVFGDLDQAPELPRRSSEETHSSKRLRDDQQRHQTDAQYELEERRRRSDERGPPPKRCGNCGKTLRPGETFREHNNENCEVVTKPRDRQCSRCHKVLNAKETFKKHNETCPAKR